MVKKGVEKRVRLPTGNYCLPRRIRPNTTPLPPSHTNYMPPSPHRVDRVARPLTHTQSQTGRERKGPIWLGPYSVLFTKHEKDQSGRDGYFPRWAIFSPNETMEQIEAGNPGLIPLLCDSPRLNCSCPPSLLL